MMDKSIFCTEPATNLLAVKPNFNIFLYMNQLPKGAAQTNPQLSYDRSCRSLDQDSPSKKKKMQANYSSTTHLLVGKKVPSSLQTKPSDLETTVFYIPGVDVKLHYNSKTLKTESPNASRGSSLPRTLSKESKLYGMKDTATSPLPSSVHSKTNTLLPPQSPPMPSAKGKGSSGVKTAKLYAWVALQSLPEEMVISPNLLDFLEKALETIPITPVERNYAVSSQDEDIGQFDLQDPLEESTTSLVSSSTSPYSSFPVDVVVYVRVQPSQIRFSCLPVSRVECMLKLPSLDLVFSSNRSELETLGPSHPSDSSIGNLSMPSGSKPNLNKSGMPGTSPGLGSPLGRTRHSSSQSDLTSSSSNSSGLSFTACMSDFSLYVFHPYGAGKQKSAVSGLTPGPSGLGQVDEEPTSVTGRKDSLSINLEFVKVSLSRMRRSGGASFFESVSANKTPSKMDTTLINISAVCDIGSASFKYDMRRLSEILAFPRAWYRRSIARHLFLGDQTINLPGSSEHSTYIVQTLDFHLGHNTMVTKPCGALESPMATITKITRRRHENPPHGVASVQEWFNYVTAMRNEELNLLRNVDANNAESSTAVKNSSLLSGFRGGSSYNHETETIFALPRMQLDFKSIHVQEPQEPVLQDDSKPKVECSVLTEFTDHICVTMDAELIIFLHDMVSAYLKEKEKVKFPPRVFTTRPGQKSPVIQINESSSEKEKEENTNYTYVDWREFMCNTWHLEPTLRLISWTGRKIDPVGVDYILQKLGFHHARTTIPKWLQRGVMDPLDKVLSVLIKKLGSALQDEKEKKGKDKEEH
ncbi:transmembrane protein KIAA1109-like isoform X2 [Xenopus tropicalis]|uniref:Transmembrane protein KIAA1109-like isoform X2 n=1 Tax=Xenopus tropicalis TaxID=8364 RepID=A0A8J1JN78_XENTR|nr:transmembrane protein KIAA1109-like isoform X2 [Xenopus tropicalis]